ncbi:hypothetical protein N7519_002117 [Penicillium mononematosum]|uniref:uncharacterized protein n=1 Tax=Penicillium mononematosum TaxID=268346 RepID=UPI0025480D9F|nr:uncharacterized protein N7519_002117 [Penicillium mononematosum]KAJ6187209.1 hypothetical protein N7519_002117 [Penicillium mononematosum]
MSPSGRQRRGRRPQKRGKISVKSRASDHSLVKKTVSKDHLKDYKQHCGTLRRLLPAPTLLPALAAVLAQKATSYLREDIHSDYGLSWYISMLAFKATILGIIEDELDQSDPNVTIWHARMDATPTAFAALSKRGETTSGSSPHWTTHLYGGAAFLWGLHGLIMQQAAHRLNVTKWEEEKKEKAAKAAEETQLQKEVRALRGQVSALTERIVALESANAA